MKKFLILLLIIAAASHFGTNEVSAQKLKKPKEVIIVEFLAPNHKEFNKSKVPINRTTVIKVGVGGVSSTGCGECTPEVIATQPSDYLFTAIAFRMGENKANVGFEIEVDGECKTRKNFKVYRNRQTKLQLNCGISLVAYYGFESEETN